MTIDEVLSEIEDAGAWVRLDGKRVRIRFLKAEQREQLSHHVAFLRAHREEVAKVLHMRQHADHRDMQ